MTSPGEAGDDADVITASLRHPERFAAVFDRHAPHIHRYLARRLGGQVADDLLGETFLIAFGGRGRYDAAFRSARPWLYGIATNLVGQRRRAEAREYRLRASLGPPDEEVSHADRVAERVTAQAMNARLAGALAGLARGDRDVLLLIAWEGLAYEEVAAALGIPVGTVRSRLNRARRKVRAELAPAEEVSNHG
ncbi:RNA polymerase sigma-70 factor (ECF subfamily) [Amycolatopsis lexingtonensis]|uniref:RNA polymerase sigma-70 factor (ECF subfamily) n=1 Tax=Amycolatopsis lexingtonensis TaxID=218822 RepID=A0ABR9I2H5_9PSEU|nr:RNA polymerase sigma factor [Amycolatopsis lexingtonensis]MBE1497137.1 RNA polymerase sigma-70 factor (ECF subfamily) [Amycolatopsis lexingtonensis]